MTFSHLPCIGDRLPRRAPPSPASALLALATVLLATISAAEAVAHLMVVQEVFLGTPANPNAQYVLLRLVFPDNNFVAGT